MSIYVVIVVYHYSIMMAKVVIQNDAQITNMDLKNDAFSIGKG